MSGFVERCRSLIQSRGLWGFFTFAVKRINRRTADIVFETDPREGSAAYRKPIPEELQIHIVDRNNILKPEVAPIVRQALAGENSIYREELTKKGCLVAISRGDTLVHCSFVQFETSYKTILNEPDDVPLIGNCWTSPECRGQGLYPYAITKCLEQMAARGFKRVIISCAPDNFPSIAGIEKVGFRRVRSVRSTVFLTKLLLQRLESGNSHRYRIALL